MTYMLETELTEEIKKAGIISLVGGLLSFSVATFALFFLRRKEAMHFCNPNILFTFIIIHCSNSIVYFVQGALLLSNPDFGDRSITGYDSWRIFLRGVQEFSFLVWIFLAIVIFYDSFMSFKNPFKKRKHIWVIIGAAFIIPLCIIMIFSFLTPCNDIVESPRVNYLLLFCLPIVIAASILFHFKLSRQSAYYYRMMKENFLLKQIVRVQRSYLAAFVLFFLWELLFVTVLPDHLQCKYINSAVKSFTSFFLMIPFLLNIWKLYANFPASLHNVSLSEWVIYQLRNGIVQFIMRGFQEIFGQKKHAKKDLVDQMIVVSKDSFSKENSSPLRDSLLENSLANSADIIIQLYIISVVIAFIQYLYIFIKYE